jgi:predicted nuclease of predicted toxin-antitoxin system
MIILLDEQVTGLTDFMISLGWETKNVHTENLRGAKDITVVKHAKENGYVFITQDEKASQLADLHQVPCVHVSLAKLAEITHQELLELNRR